VGRSWVERAERVFGREQSRGSGEIMGRAFERVFGREQSRVECLRECLGESRVGEQREQGGWDERLRECLGESKAERAGRE
jgi:hypothetical protein